MDLAGCHFTYAGVSSREYGLWFANAETSAYTSINGDTQTVTVFSSRGNRKFFVSDSLVDSPVSIDVDILTDDAHALSVQEIKEIEKWLFNRKGYFKLYVDIADDCSAETYEIIDGVEYRYYFNCRFINPRKIQGNGGIPGFSCTMECDSLMLWQDAITKTIVPEFAEDESAEFTIDIDTCMDEYVYPIVNFTIGESGGNIMLVAIDDDNRSTSFVDLTPLIELSMDGNYNSISGNNYTKFQSKNFVRLLPGQNRFVLTGDVTKLEFKYSARKYL